MGTFRDRWGTTGLGWEVEGRISIIWYLCTKMGGLEWVAVVGSPSQLSSDFYLS